MKRLPPPHSVIWGENAHEILHTLNDRWRRGYIDVTYGILLKCRDREWVETLSHTPTLYITHMTAEDLDSKTLIQMTRYREQTGRTTIISTDTERTAEAIVRDIGGKFTIVQDQNVWIPPLPKQSDHQLISYPPETIRDLMEKILSRWDKNTRTLSCIVSILRSSGAYTTEEASIVAHRVYRSYPSKTLREFEETDPDRANYLKSLVEK